MKRRGLLLATGALAAGLGVAPSLLPFQAGEDMNDDLRHMVWRGHYLGFGPADVLLHVPVDRVLMQANPRVQIFGPYHRERTAIGWSFSAASDSICGTRSRLRAIAMRSRW